MNPQQTINDVTRALRLAVVVEELPAEFACTTTAITNARTVTTMKNIKSRKIS